MRPERAKFLLALTPSLALTDQLLTATMMAVAYLFVLPLGSFCVKLSCVVTRNQFSRTLQALFFSFFVILIDLIYRTYFPMWHEELGPYLFLVLLGGLWVSGWNEKKNCSFLFSFKMALLFSGILLSVAFIREVFGKGTWMGVPVIDGFSVAILSLPAGGFLMAGILIWLYGTIKEGRHAN